MKCVNLKVNGIQRKYIVEEDRVLLDLLREDLRLTGAKQSCDRKGQCGACTVIVNGKTVRSCLTRVAKIDGAEVLTVEGLGTPDNPHLIQEAFVIAGAIQCGYCTPGMIMATKALLDKNANPSDEQIKHALRNNLCRCTGYSKIIEAVQLASRFLRGETTPSQVMPDTDDQIGVAHKRPWSMLKACGLAEFSADIVMPGALEIAVVRSPHHRARLLKIDSSDAEKMPGVVGVMTAADIKGSNIIGFEADQPLLCTDNLPVLGAAVAIVAADTRQQARAAANAVKVDYEVLAPMLTPSESLAQGAPEVHPGTPNMCHEAVQIKGDAKAALDASAAVVSGEFYSPLIHQAPLEPEATVAYLDGQGDDAQLVVIGRSIWIHQHAQMIQDAVGWDNVRYQEAFTGGQFGIKCDLTSEPYAAAAALHYKRPVRYIPSLTESFWITTKRHDFSMKARLGADKSGRLTGLDMDIIVENGAYMSIGKEIITRAHGMLSSGYNIPHVSACSKLVYTNNAWGGAARGAGPPQVNYALESCMDLLARKLNMDPCEFRRINALQPGQSTSNGQVAEDGWALNACLEKIQPEYERAKKEARQFQSGSLRRGVGLAGSSFGVGEPSDISHVAVELDSDGGVSVYGSVAEPGEGNDASLTQLCAHLMDIEKEKVRLVTRDTELTPDSGISAGSRQTYMSGKALVVAIDALKQAMEQCDAKTHDDLVKAGKPTRYMGVNTMSHTGMDEIGQGKHWDSHCHGVQLAEVEVDTAIGDVRVIKMITVVDAGIIINPLTVIGQLEGGMDMGAGMALREEYVHGDTVDWVTYKFPKIKDHFDKQTILLETPRKNGPLGATGVGEFTLVPTAPAVINAIEDAIGVRIYDLPATPEKVLETIKAKKVEQ